MSQLVKCKRCGGSGRLWGEGVNEYPATAPEHSLVAVRCSPPRRCSDCKGLGFVRRHR